MGVGSIELCDFDTVEEVNFGAQGYRPDQLGGLKAEATQKDLITISPELDCYTIPKKFAEIQHFTDYTAIFCCVDCMDARSQIWVKSRENDIPMIDTRMSGLTSEVYYVNKDLFAKYANTLFPNEDAYPEPCTARSVLFTSNIISGLAVSLWVQGLRQSPDYPFLRMSLTDYTLDVISIPEAAQPQEASPSEDAAPEEPPSETESDPEMSSQTDSSTAPHRSPHTFLGLPLPDGPSQIALP